MKTSKRSSSSLRKERRTFTLSLSLSFLVLGPSLARSRNCRFSPSRGGSVEKQKGPIQFLLEKYKDSLLSLKGLRWNFFRRQKKKGEKTPPLPLSSLHKERERVERERARERDASCSHLLPPLSFLSLSSNTRDRPSSLDRLSPIRGRRTGKTPDARVGPSSG